MNSQSLGLWLIGLLLSSTLVAQKPMPVRNFEFGADPTDSPSFMRGNQRVSTLTGFPIAIYNPGDPVAAAEPETMAREYLNNQRTTLGLTPADLENLHLHAVRESAVGTTVRLRQFIRDIPVRGGEITVSITPDNTIGFVMNAFVYGVALDDQAPQLAVADARARAAQAIGLAGATSYEEQELVIWQSGETTRLIHRILLVTDAPLGQWEIFVDAHSGTIYKIQDVACYYHDHKREITPALPPAAPMLMVDGTGNVFDPDPLSSGGATYGDSGYTDGNDATSTQLQGEIVSVTLPDITFSGGMYRLVGPYAEIRDDESPFRGTFSRSNSNWNVNRTNNAFEAVNVYYHIDASMRYLNEDLGVTVMPYNYSGGVRYDPSGLNNADNSHYVGGAQRLAFGDGGVDDAEDSDVIHHELGHGLHDWITTGGLSQVNGLSEGCGDYWAASYNRSLGLWSTSDPAYNWVFIWDGHNEFWNGRITNVSSTYPSGLSGSIHASGQLWATSMMLVWDAIGKAKTDVIFWEGLGMTNGSSNQNDAANAVYQAANNLGYSNADRLSIHTILTNRGYTLPNFVLPVELLAFTARKDGNTTRLDWATATEQNNDYFEIERSVDGGRTFLPIGRIPGAGNSEVERTYDFIDAAPSQGSNAYRLKQVDFDGTFSYSSIAYVDFTQTGDWTITPNPVANEINLLGPVLESPTHYTLSDNNGRIIAEGITTSANSTIPVAELIAGTYWLRITAGSQSWVLPVVEL